MPDLKSSLQKVHEKISVAYQAARSDRDASPVLVAVVREFAGKADKSMKLLGEGKGRDAVIELEQAGDSAKAAAEADSSAAAATTRMILDAHLAICMLKATLDNPS